MGKVTTNIGNVITIISVVVLFALFVLTIYLGIRNSKRIDALWETIMQEKAKTDFTIRELSNGEIPFDSCYIEKDTIFYYDKEGAFKGKTVISVKKE